MIVWSLSAKEAWTQTTERSIKNLMLAIFSWVAERERENLSEQTKAGANCLWAIIQISSPHYAVPIN